MPIGIISALIQSKLQKESGERQQKNAREEAIRQQEFNKSERIAQQEFQKDMSNTAIQRRKADLEEAGFNAGLALGGEASTPQGTSSEAVAYDPNIAENMQLIATTALVQAIAGAPKRLEKNLNKIAGIMTGLNLKK